MKLQSFFRIALVLAWFFATNHCLFEVCNGPDAGLAHAATDPCSDHEHEEQSSHPCGTPCDLESDGSVLGPALKHLTPPPLDFVTAFVGSSSHIDSPVTRRIPAGTEEDLAPLRARRARLLLDSPNAPPLP